MFKRSQVLWDPMPLQHVIVFYLGIPILMSAMFGINHAGLGKHLTIAQGITYWLGIWVPFWLMLDLATRTSALILRPWSAPLWVLLIMGSALAMLISRPYIVWYIGQYTNHLPEGMAVSPPAFASAWRELDRLLGFLGTPLFWMAINYYYDRVLGIPRYRGRMLVMRDDADSDRARTPLAALPVAETASVSTPPTAPAATEGVQNVPAFFALLPAKVGTNVIALQAEDHYVRVHTTEGSALVRYRFSDAITELDAVDGLQVHRSSWARKSAIVRVETEERTWMLVLTGDLRVPVSQGFRETVRAARLPGLGKGVRDANPRTDAPSSM